MFQSLDAMADGLEKKSLLTKKIASGDFTAEVSLASKEDSLGQALQTMVSDLNEVLTQVKQAASQVAAGSAQVSDSSQSLSQGATQQAASLEEITSFHD